MVPGSVHMWQMVHKDMQNKVRGGQISIKHWLDLICKIPICLYLCCSHSCCRVSAPHFPEITWLCPVQAPRNGAGLWRDFGALATSIGKGVAVKRWIHFSKRHRPPETTLFIVRIWSVLCSNVWNVYKYDCIILPLSCGDEEPTGQEPVRPAEVSHPPSSIVSSSLDFVPFFSVSAAMLAITQYLLLFLFYAIIIYLFQRIGAHDT